MEGIETSPVTEFLAFSVSTAHTKFWIARNCFCQMLPLHCAPGSPGLVTITHSLVKVGLYIVLC